MNWPRCEICHTKTGCWHNMRHKKLSQNPVAKRFRVYYAKHKDEYNKRRRERRALAAYAHLPSPRVPEAARKLSALPTARQLRSTFTEQFVAAMTAGFKQGFAAEITI